MSARMGKWILEAMVLLAALTWLAALALASPTPISPSDGTQQPGENATARQQGQNPQPGAGARNQGARAPQPSPFAGPEDERLSVWAGAWEETVRYAGDAEGKPSGTGRWMARPFFGLYLVINYNGKGPEGGYNAHGVMAYDHETKTYRLWWFDDGANIGEYTGTWKDDHTLVFELKRTTNGKTFRERMTYVHIADDELQTRIEQSWGTEPFKVYLEASAHRMALPEGQQGAGNEQRQQQQQQRKRPPSGN
jgi:Protein of unknown function (DUF1579)